MTVTAHDRAGREIGRRRDEIAKRLVSIMVSSRVSLS